MSQNHQEMNNLPSIFIPIPPPPTIFTIELNTQKEEEETDLETKTINYYATTTIDNNKLKKIIVGYKHMIYLFENGEMFASNELNEYGQCGESPMKVDNYNNKLTNLLKINIEKNKILKECKVIDIFTLCNFTIYLAIHNENKKQMLLASGWNNGGCCSCNKEDDFIKEISPCYFNQFNNLYNNVYNNNITQNNNHVIDNNNSAISTELINEKIINVACGGSHLHVITENNLTKEQFIYECGSNVGNQLTSINEKVSILRKTNIMEFIKLNDYSNCRIKKMYGSYEYIAFITGMFF